MHCYDRSEMSISRGLPTSAKGSLLTTCQQCLLFWSALVFILVTLPAHAVAFRVVVFGDMFSDTGRFHNFSQGRAPRKDVYYNHRFSDGPIWVDYLQKNNHSVHSYAMALSTACDNLALDGDIPCFADQVQEYLTSNETHDLAIVWIGMHDYFDLLGPVDVADQRPPGFQVTSCIQEGIQTLVTMSSIRNVLVFNLPTLERKFRAGSILRRVRYLVKGHNNLLSEVVSTLALQYTNVSFGLYDVYNFTDTLHNQSSSLGYVHCDKPCIKYSGANIGQKCTSPSQYCFYDEEYNPTTVIHRRLTNNLLRFLKAPNWL